MEDSAPEREMTPPELIAFLFKRFEVETVEELAAKIGHPARQIYRWRSGQEPRFGTTIALLEDAGLIQWEDREQSPDEAAAYLKHLQEEYAEIAFDLVKRGRLMEKGVLGWLAQRDGPYAEAVAALLPEYRQGEGEIVEASPDALRRLEAVEATVEAQGEQMTTALKALTAGIRRLTRRLDDEAPPAKRSSAP